MAADLIGKVYGRLTVVGRSEDYQYPAHPERGWYPRWICRCDCGTQLLKLTQDLSKPKCPSCPECALQARVVSIPQPAVAVGPPPVIVRPGKAAGHIILIGEEYWTASTDLKALLAFATATARFRQTTLCFSNGTTVTQVRDYRVTP